MSAFVALAAAWALVISGIAALVRPGRLAWALGVQDVLPRRVRPAVAVALPVAETVAGVGLLVAFAASWAVAWVALSVVGALLFAAYLAYLLVLVRRGFGGDCGCGVAGESVGRFAVVRSAVLAGGLAAASVSGLAKAAGLAALLGRPLMVAAAMVAGLLALIAHAGWSHSDRVMEEFRHELDWQVRP